MTLNRHHLGRTILEILDLPPSNANVLFARRILNAMLDSMKSALLRGEEVSIAKFGKLRLKRIKGHGRPKVFLTQKIQATGWTKFPGRNQIIFCPAAPLRAMVNMTEDGYTPDYRARRSRESWPMEDSNEN